MTDPFTKLSEGIPRIIFSDHAQQLTYEVFNPNEYPQDIRGHVGACMDRFAAVVRYSSNTVAEIQQYKKSGFRDELNPINSSLPLGKDSIGIFTSSKVHANFEAMLIAGTSLLDTLVRHLLAYKVQTVRFNGFAKKGRDGTPGSKTLDILQNQVDDKTLPTRSQLIDLINKHKPVWIDGMVEMRDYLIHQGVLPNMIGFWVFIESGRSTSLRKTDVQPPTLEFSGGSIEVERYCRETIPLVREFTEQFRDLLFPPEDRKKKIGQERGL